MASKHIMVKNVRLWYHSLKKTSYIPEKDSITGKYNFREINWTKGVITDDIVNEYTRFITRASDKTFTDLSLTKTGDNDWGKRKVIHSIKGVLQSKCMLAPYKRFRIFPKFLVLIQFG